jgi:hypothetical protein
LFQAKAEIPRPWKTSDAMSLGVILAGLSPAEFASLDNATLAGVTPAALRHLVSILRNSLSKKLSSYVYPGPTRSHNRVARFFLVQDTKTGTKLSNNRKIYQIAVK